MKKLLLLIMTFLCLTGCGKYKLENAVADFSKKIENSKSYKLNGTMEIESGEEIFSYNIDTYFLKDDFYKVVLVNQTNNHEQVILKNKDGLYVITPSLNKSFKFDSIWPNNSSQAYILGNLLTDIKDDNNKEFSKTDNGFMIKCKVNYPNNNELVYQKLYFDKNMNIEKVEVFNDSDIVKIKVNFKSVNLKARLSEDDFLLEDLVDPEIEEEKTCEDSSCPSKTTSALENIIYPLYIPTNTHLNSEETVSTETGERAILTFGGDKNFVIVEETVQVAKDFEVIPVFGDPLMLDKTIGAISSNSVSWNTDNISYYLVSSDLTSEEMVNIAKSLGNSQVVISTK